jgi:signal transduction histidine kinase
MMMRWNISYFHLIMLYNFNYLTHSPYFSHSIKKCRNSYNASLSYSPTMGCWLLNYHPVFERESILAMSNPSGQKPKDRKHAIIYFSLRWKLRNLSGLKFAVRFSDEIVKPADVFAVMEKHNQNQAANHEAVLNNIADGVLVLDLQGGFLSANPALLGMVSKEDLQEIIAKPLGKTIKWKHKIFSVTTAPVPDVGTVTVFRDETRRHEIERAKDAMLATASHELRTPLTAVMNYLEMLIVFTRMGKTNTELFTEHLNRALENSQRLHRLILAILDQAQIQQAA